ncbi:SOS response-associated peptidase [Falsiroseomonas sp. E2-1-a20]|uniref:SOS response-associated peptidase n=1 Tax=Falsiroseomonas sp. E2-1-a20 TaxID=3239300 RepID=UPI003F2C0338
MAAWDRNPEGWLNLVACSECPRKAEPMEAGGMCGRFTQRYTWAELHALLDLVGAPRNLRPRHNIAPTTSIDVMRAGEAGRELASMRWGLIPAWWKKSAKEVPSTFNARAETVAEKPMFRDAFKRRRCIIPASGFYEWTGEKKDRQPHLFTAADGAPVLALPASGIAGATRPRQRKC